MLIYFLSDTVRPGRFRFLILSQLNLSLFLIPLLLDAVEMGVLVITIIRHELLMKLCDFSAIQESHGRLRGLSRDFLVDDSRWVA